jgi:hypothetical protein
MTRADIHTTPIGPNLRWSSITKRERNDKLFPPPSPLPSPATAACLASRPGLPSCHRGLQPRNRRAIHQDLARSDTKCDLNAAGRSVPLLFGGSSRTMCPSALWTAELLRTRRYSELEGEQSLIAPLKLN